MHQQHVQVAEEGARTTPGLGEAIGSPDPAPSRALETRRVSGWTRARWQDTAEARPHGSRAPSQPSNLRTALWKNTKQRRTWTELLADTKQGYRATYSQRPGATQSKNSSFKRFPWNHRRRGSCPPSQGICQPPGGHGGYKPTHISSRFLKTL